MLGTIVEEVLRCRPTDRICVGIDGAAGSGKSTFADEIARLLKCAGRPVVRSTTDSFHNPRAIRYRQGRSSAEGYYRDSHDTDAIRRVLLHPFVEGDAFRVAAFDEPSDSPIDVAEQLCPPAAVLVFDGLFVHRPELLPYWSYSIYLDAAARLQRQLTEAASRIAKEEFAVLLSRYVRGWQVYVDECWPAAQATRVVDNNELTAPRFVAGQR